MTTVASTRARVAHTLGLERNLVAVSVAIFLPASCGRSIGLHYLVRSLAIAPTAFIGGLLWHVTAPCRSGSQA